MKETCQHQVTNKPPPALVTLHPASPGGRAREKAGSCSPRLPGSLPAAAGLSACWVSPGQDPGRRAQSQAMLGADQAIMAAKCFQWQHVLLISMGTFGEKVIIPFFRWRKRKRG